MMNLHSILCKVNANSNILLELLEPHSSFRFQYRLLTMTAFLEIAVYNPRWKVNGPGYPSKIRKKRVKLEQECQSEWGDVPAGVLQEIKLGQCLFL